MYEKIHYDGRYASLLTTYRCQSYAQAAEVLGLTASAVAQQIHSIERELNAPLFVRQEKHLTPTAQCRLVVEYIERIQSMCQKMSDEVAVSQRGVGHLTVGVTSSVESFALAGMVERLNRPDSPLQITVRDGAADKLCAMVQGYALDLAVIEGNCGCEGLNELILDTDYLTVALPAGSDYARRVMLRPEELLRAPLVLKPRESGTRRLFEGTLKSIGINPEQLNVIMEAENTATLLRLVAGGYGLSVLSQKACEPARRRGKIATVPLSGVSMSRSVKIVYRKEQQCTLALQALQRCYHEAMKGREK